MNRTIKEATVKRFHCESHDEFSSYLPPSRTRRVKPYGARHAAGTLTSGIPTHPPFSALLKRVAVLLIERSG